VTGVGVGRFILQTDSGAHPASCPMGIEGFSPGVKRPGREVDHSASYGTEVRNEWSCASTPPVCLNWVNRDKFTFTFFWWFELPARNQVRVLQYAIQQGPCYWCSDGRPIQRHSLHGVRQSQVW